jgi:hypothetical protein
LAVGTKVYISSLEFMRAMEREKQLPAPLVVFAAGALKEAAAATSLQITVADVCFARYVATCDTNTYRS